MLKNYFKIAFRNILRFKIYSSINIIGLAVSISACIMISLWVANELSYDKFNKNADRIYRPVFSGKMNNIELSSALTPSPMGETLHKDLPEVETYTRIYTFGGTPVIRYEGKIFTERHFLYVDSSFFEVFTAEFIKGDPKTALMQPNTVVLTESMAYKYFGTVNCMDKILNIDKNRNYAVTGVIKDFPAESHFHFDFLGSLSTIDDSRNPLWLTNNYHTYLLLKNGTDPHEFQKKLKNETSKYLSPQLKAIVGFSLEQFEAAGNRYGYILEPLNSIHFYSHKQYEMEENSNIIYIYIYSAIALAILLIAGINFINLSTARSERRAKEIGIRKTIGSNKTQIAGQFLFESVLTSLIAVVLSIGIVEFLLPFFNNLADKKINLNLTGNIYAFPLIICFAVIIGLAAGSYPAFYLSSFQPIQVLKSDIRKWSRKAVLRSSLVIFQFAISIMLIVSTFVIYNQLKYIQEKNLGFNKEQVIVINKIYNIGSQIESFKHELSINPNVVSMSNSTAVPGDQENDGSYKLRGSSTMQFANMSIMRSDVDFQKTYQMSIAEGRFFSHDHPSDTMAVIINQAAARVLGSNNLTGKYLTDASDKPNSQIIGIVKDFNFKSLHEAVAPLIIYPAVSKNFVGRFLSIRIKPADYAGTKSFLESTWKKYAGDVAIDYGFLDQDLQKLYMSDERTSKIASIFSILAIFIACLGLLGLATFITEQRTKEMGIRKVLGASVTEIMVLLSKEFAKWVLIANLIAWPVAYYLMNKWLQNFAYKTEISIWVFLIAGILALIIALLTVSANAVKAATANPVKSLKYE